MSFFFFLSCDSGGPGSSDPEPNFSSLYSQVFGSARCAVCHLPGGTGVTLGQLDFSSASVAYAGLMGSGSPRFSQSPHSINCSGIRVVDTSSPSRSFLLGITDSSSAATLEGIGCTPDRGSHIEAGYALSSGEKSAIIRWIEAGASFN